jgi:hypothetical protein
VHSSMCALCQKRTLLRSERNDFDSIEMKRPPTEAASILLLLYED